MFHALPGMDADGAFIQDDGDSLPLLASDDELARLTKHDSLVQT
jgi:hypothetical protein